MKNKINKILKYLTIISVLFLIIITTLVSLFTYNITPSEPLGLYVKIPFKEPNIDDYIRFNVKTEYKEFLEKNKEDDINTFIKNISAKEGDHIIMKGEDVIINGKLVAKRLQLVDFENPEIDKVLKKGEYISISKNPLSFDSRYIGIIYESEILGVYKYTHLFETKDIRKFNENMFGNKY